MCATTGVLELYKFAKLFHDDASYSCDEKFNLDGLPVI